MSPFFVDDLKSRKVYVFQYFSMVFDHQKPLDFRLFFHSVFMFFQSRSPGPFLEGQVLNFYEKLHFGAIFDFRDFQKGTSWDTFLLKT